MFSIDNLDIEFDSDGEISKTGIITSEEPCNLQENKEPSVDIFRKPVIPVNSLKNNLNCSSNSLQTDDLQHKTDCLEDIATGVVKAVRRKFPGPAGLLPDKPPRSFNDSSLLLDNAENDVEDRRDEPILCSQASELVFSDPPFKKLRRDFGIDQPESPLRAFTVDWVKKKALSKGLKGRKIPFLAVILQSVDCSSADPLVTLRDPTGELLGALHREVWKEMAGNLRIGAAIALKEVGVLSTGVSRRQVILNMTKNNIVTIYSPTDEGEVFVHSVQLTSCLDIVRNVSEWQTRVVQSAAPLPARSNGLFQTFNLPAKVSTAPQKTNTRQLCDGQSHPKQLRRADLDNAGSFLAQVPGVTKSVQKSPANLNSDFDCFIDDEDLANLDDNHFSSNPSVISSTQKCGNSSSLLTLNVPPTLNLSKYSTPQILSQAETSMLDEVLSGVDLDEFE